MDRGVWQATVHGVTRSGTCLSMHAQVLRYGFPGGSVVKNPAANEAWTQSLGLQKPLEEEMATHSSNLAWRIPWTEEPGGLQSMGSQRVGHD